MSSAPKKTTKRRQENDPLNHDVRVQTHMLASWICVHIVISGPLELGFHPRLEVWFAHDCAADDWDNGQRSAPRNAADEIWDGNVHSDSQGWRGLGKASHAL